MTNNLLTVTIKSFAYKDGIPADPTGNGGGFVFDCRALPNPGRDEQYRTYSGKDDIIRRFMEAYPEVKRYLENICRIIDQSVENYTERGFNSLSISFGCTGGQHRSVFCAEKLANYISGNYPKVKVNLVHTVLDKS